MVSYNLKLTSKFVRNFRKVPERYHYSVKEALEEIREAPSEGKPLHLNLAGRRSWRIGTYRIIYKVDEKDKNIVILNVDHRSVVYN